MQSKISSSIDEEVNASKSNDESNSLTGHERGDIGSPGSNLTTPVTAEEFAGKVDAANDPTKQLKQFRYPMNELRQPPPKRTVETDGLI